MTRTSPLLNPRRVALTAFAALSLSALMVPAAMAADTSSEASFQVASSGDSTIRAGAAAFKKGEYDKAVTFNNAALKAGNSRRKNAIAQNNLCASLGAMGELDAAAEACDVALELRPDYAPALANKSALAVKLATLTSMDTATE